MKRYMWQSSLNKTFSRLVLKTTWPLLTNKHSYVRVLAYKCMLICQGYSYSYKTWYTSQRLNMFEHIFRSTTQLLYDRHMFISV